MLCVPFVILLYSCMYVVCVVNQLRSVKKIVFEEEEE